MNVAVREYVASVLERQPHLRRGVIFEIGSYDVNGTVRDLFSDPKLYIGTDRRPGPNVDVVWDSHCPPRWHSFDAVVCLEMLEHDSIPLATLRNAYKILENGGLLILTARGIGYWLHDEPEDYWRFTPHGLRLLMEQAGFTVEEVIDHTESKGVFGLGRKPIGSATT